MPTYTSYYANRAVYGRDAIIVPVSNSYPKGLVPGGTMPSCIPPWKGIVVPYKDGLISKEEYRIRYISFLNGNKENIIREYTMLKNRSEGKDIILLCYEKDGDFCHRHILAKWLSEKTGDKITPLKDNQQVLF